MSAISRPMTIEEKHRLRPGDVVLHRFSRKHRRAVRVVLAPISQDCVQVRRIHRGEIGNEIGMSGCIEDVPWTELEVPE